MKCLPYESSKIKYRNGRYVWFNKYEKAHSFNDQPATVFADGTKYYYKDHNYHRGNNKPAIIVYNGSSSNKYYYKEGEEYLPEEVWQ